MFNLEVREKLRDENKNNFDLFQTINHLSTKKLPRDIILLIGKYMLKDHALELIYMWMVMVMEYVKSSHCVFVSKDSLTRHQNLISQSFEKNNTQNTLDVHERALNKITFSGQHNMLVHEIISDHQDDTQTLRMIRVLMMSNDIDVNSKDRYKQISLHKACSNEKIATAKLLLAYGADVNASDHLNAVPLHLCAAYNEDSKLAALLIDQGAEIDPKDNRGETPLHETCRKNNINVAKLLIDRGANPNIQSNEWLETPMHLAVSYNNDKIVSLLKNAGADTNLHNKLCDTPLSIAEREGRSEIVRVLKMK